MPFPILQDRAESLAQLQRLIGVHKWTLSLRHEMMRLEYGHDFDEAKVHEISMGQLAAVLGIGGMRQHQGHWQRALQIGHDGPVTVPFVKADGSFSVVESACSLFAHNGDRYLTGVFKRLPDDRNLGRNARVMASFLESFIENSPSNIVVVDNAGSVVSANREFIRFVGHTQKSDIIHHSALDAIYAVSTSLGVVVRDALRDPKPTRGRHEVIYNNSMRQTLYWRAFPLSLDASIVPPKVFVFDLHGNGARIVTA